MSTDISEKGLESLIVRHMTGTDGLDVPPNAAAEPPAPYGGIGYFAAPTTFGNRMRKLPGSERVGSSRRKPMHRNGNRVQICRRAARATGDSPASSLLNSNISRR